MKHFSRLPLKAYIFILSCLTLQKTDATKIKGSLPSIPAVAQFLNEFIKPIIENHGKPNFRANAENSFIKKIIHDKIKQLKPILQDHDNNDEHNTVTLEGEEDTHILEFVPSPKQALRFKNQTADVEKFKKMQRKIKKALNREPISEDTKKFITKSVDEMVAHIVSNKCVWTTGKAALRLGDHSGRKPFTFNHMWSHLLNKIQRRFADGGEDKNKHNLKQFQHFVSEILNDTQVLSEDYRVVCSVVNVNNLNVTGIRTLQNNELTARSIRRRNPDGLRASEITLDKKDINVNETCPYFKICSEELSDFMTDFYINLNETAVSTLTNYAAMFTRDVKEGHNNEKQTVITLINNTTFGLGKKINIIFKKQTEKFSLDKSKDKNSNINALRQYITKTVNHVKRQVMNDVASNLKELRPKLRLTIEKDIDVNLDVDLGNLERELSGKICMVFEICNGKYVSRRNIDYSRPKIDKNHLFVRVQLTLDDKKKPERKIAVGVGQAMRANGLSTNYNKYVSITRTDAPSTTTVATTKRTVATTRRTVATTRRTVATTRRTVATTRTTDTLITKTDAYSTTNTENTYRETRLVTEKNSNTPGISKISYSIPVYVNIVPNKVKLTSAETETNNTAQIKTKRHDQSNNEKFDDSHSNTNTKKFKTIDSLEAYHETHLDVFTEKISTNTEKTSTDTEKNLTEAEKISNSNMTDNEHGKKKKHRQKNYKGTKFNATSTTKFKTIESLETYRETVLQSKNELTLRDNGKTSNLNMSVDEHTKKKKHRQKKYKGTKLNATSTTKFKTIESLETYSETVLQSKNKLILRDNGKVSNLNITIDEHAKMKKHHAKKYHSGKNHKKDEMKSGETVILGSGKINLANEIVHQRSQKDKTEKKIVDNVQNNTKTKKVQENAKPTDFLGKQETTDTVNIKEFKFNMTIGGLRGNTENHTEKHKIITLKDDETGGREKKEENKEIHPENMFYKRSRDVTEPETCQANGTKGECKDERKNNKTIDSKNENENSDDAYYYYDYGNNTDILDQNGQYEMFESDYIENNVIEPQNKKP